MPMAEDFAPHVTPRTTFKQVRLETCAQKELTMRTTMTRQLILQTELDHALQNQEFKLVYQPIMDLGTHHVVGFEALLRWDHPNRGIISPAHFIPVAEEICPRSTSISSTGCSACRTRILRCSVCRRRAAARGVLSSGRCCRSMPSRSRKQKRPRSSRSRAWMMMESR